MMDKIAEIKKMVLDVKRGAELREASEIITEIVNVLNLPDEPQPDQSRLLSPEAIEALPKVISTQPRPKPLVVAEAQDAKTASIKDAEIQALHRERKGEVWYWQGDGTDHLESLTCPVLIEAGALRNFGKARIEALIEWLRTNPNQKYKVMQRAKMGWYENLLDKDWDELKAIYTSKGKANDH